MSSNEQLWNLFDKINSVFQKTTLSYPLGKYPRVFVEGKNLTSELVDNQLQSCVELYNQIDSIVEALKLTVPEIYEEQKILIENRVIGKKSEGQKIVEFLKSQYINAAGNVSRPPPSTLPLGIRGVIDLLTRSYEYLQSGLLVNSDELYYTTTISFKSLRVALRRLLGRFNYVMMYPHRILVDRTILETGLRKHGMFQVLDFVRSAEENFNNRKYIEFCAISRNALHQAVGKTCLFIDGEEHGFSSNLKRLSETGFLRSTIAKQMKEFSGSLSSCGSHPPKEKLTENEAKFLLDSLYSFLGLVSLRLSTTKKRKQK